MTARKRSGLDKTEYPTGSGIYIKEIINQTDGNVYNGSFQVIVPAKVTGAERKRSQFKTKKEAKDFALEQYNGSKNEGHEFFRITDTERRQFAYVLPQLRDAGISIEEAVNHALKTLKPQGGDRSIDQIVDELIESKRIRYERKDLRERSYRDFRHRSTAFADEFRGAMATEFQMTGHAEIKQWLIEMEVEPRTTKNYLSVVSEVLKYALQKRYMIYNPLDALTDTERKELCGSENTKEPSILTPAEAEKLITTAAETNDELGLLGAVTLALFCGIRTEEVKQLQWEAVKAEEGFVTIGSDIAKKRRIRNVTLSENAKQWLKLAAKETGPVTNNNHYNHYQKRFRKLRMKAGFETWPANAMRHSFGSYHYALHEDAMWTSRELGHKGNDTVLFDYYRALTTKKQGERYFSIAP